MRILLPFPVLVMSQYPLTCARDRFRVDVLLVFIAAYFERPMALPLSIIFVPNIVLPVMLILPFSCLFYRTSDILELIYNAYNG